MTDQGDNILGPAFGTYALPVSRQELRERADRFGDSRWGRWAISYYRKRAFNGLSDPFDVEIIDGVRTRLWPRTSRCEKRVFAGQQVWDHVERHALLKALETSKSKTFVFMDIGANVGLYSLILAAHAKKLAKKTKILAIEPDITNRSRLEFNIKASEADISVLPYAISDKPGAGHISGGETNRGEAKLQDNIADENSVEIETLHRICTTKKLSHIDAMKVDIEGQDFKALTAFFKTTPKKLWPQLLILETGREPMTALLELCIKHGYTITQRAGINSVLERQK